jgi:hypothetical protein
LLSAYPQAEGFHSRFHDVGGVALKHTGTRTRAAHQSSCVRGFNGWELIDELAWVARIQMWRRWKFVRSDRIAFNLVWLFVIFIAFSAVIFLRGCT